MANARVRLSQQTIDSIAELGQQCGIDDHDTVIKLLIRKYGDQLASLLAPDNPNTVRLSQSVPTIAKSDQIGTGKNLDATPNYSAVVETTANTVEPVVSTASESPANAFFEMEF